MNGPVFPDPASVGRPSPNEGDGFEAHVINAAAEIIAQAMAAYRGWDRFDDYDTTADSGGVMGVSRFAAQALRHRLMLIMPPPIGNARSFDEAESRQRLSEMPLDNHANLVSRFTTELFSPQEAVEIVMREFGPEDGK